jgi:hypothetical protein
VYSGKNEVFTELIDSLGGNWTVMPSWLISLLIVISIRIIWIVIVRRVRGKPPKTLREELREEQRQKMKEKAAVPFDQPDAPERFGNKCGWFAVLTKDGQRLGGHFGLKQLMRCNWTAGIEYAFKDGAFITPAVDGWTMVVGTDLPLVDYAEGREEVFQLLQDLSKEFGEAQFFMSYLSVGAEGWIRARNGVVERAYAVEEGKVLFDEGTREVDEDPDAPSPAARMAGIWSVNPETLEDRKDLTSGLGWAGNRARPGQQVIETKEWKFRKKFE